MRVHSIPIPAGEPRIDPILRDEKLLLANQAKLDAVVPAEVTALDRSTGALDAGDASAYKRQKAAVARYLKDEAGLLISAIKLRTQVVDAFKAAKIKLTISHKGMLAIAAYIKRHGLARSVGSGLKKAGLSLKNAGLNASDTMLIVSELSAKGSVFDLAGGFGGYAAQNAADARLARRCKSSAAAVSALS